MWPVTMGEAVQQPQGPNALSASSHAASFTCLVLLRSQGWWHAGLVAALRSMACTANNHGARQQTLMSACVLQRIRRRTPRTSHGSSRTRSIARCNPAWVDRLFAVHVSALYESQLMNTLCDMLSSARHHEWKAEMRRGRRLALLDKFTFYDPAGLHIPHVLFCSSASALRACAATAVCHHSVGATHLKFLPAGLPAGVPAPCRIGSAHAVLTRAIESINLREPTCQKHAVSYSEGCSISCHLSQPQRRV